MYIVQVYVHVKTEYIQQFKQASIDNASHSIQEPGVARFDVLQQEDDPSRFILYEVYRTPEDPAKHRETDHYKRWKDAVEIWMAEPCTKAVFANAFPDDNGWG